MCATSKEKKLFDQIAWFFTKQYPKHITLCAPHLFTIKKKIIWSRLYYCLPPTNRRHSSRQ
jgi:hypothetical protein